ncbi:hypothetical protein N7462_004166 [Penicillium macrosclerotiorum]|uniref:uncharacterized protein n=1 Tax=Penicillium macrosclerotiorum TaxID=303699 RepID=UPI00254837AE|nr:uncharacterized protein N7462_004166 [Penicillium macrosclerotiorum]KAJ5689774.1 hypothetical protein N7462_004166 [Penicillium macrosclerotiorum]
MARLNDLTAPLESVEALKRRFVRQNREIARVNSMQSLRIRSLESEVSHLLAENVSLREQVINLNQEVERLESSKMLQDGVYAIKSRLDAKLLELSTLASELGTLPRKLGKSPSDNPDVDSNRPKILATEPRSRVTDVDPSSGVEYGRLPAILEDKYYPRRTLESYEIQNMVQDGSILESPHSPSKMYRISDPVAESPSPEPNEILPVDQLDDSTDHPGLLPPTLETRKKKKKKFDTATIPTESTTEGERASPGAPSLQHTASGSKRKFSPDEDGLMPGFEPREDGFQFSRAKHNPRKSNDVFDFMRQDASPSKTSVDPKSSSSKIGATKRKVLEPKSVNTSLGSPRKARSSLLSDSKISQRPKVDENIISPQKSKEPETPNNKTLSQKTRVARPAAASQKQKRTSRSNNEDSFQAHTKVVLRDSPVAKPVDSLTGMIDMTAGSRPSRRQRAVVSYAEPNLRDKMRRPTKEMIDAVGGHGSRRSSSFQFVRDSLEAEDGEQKANMSPCPSADFTRNFTSLASADQAAEPFAPEDTSDQLSATVSRRRRKVALNGDADTISTSNAGSTTDPMKASKESMGCREQSRRHSSNSKSLARHASVQHDADISGELDSSLEGDDIMGWRNASAIDAGHRRETRVAARRKSMMV